MKNFRESYKKAVDAIPIPDFYVREISQTERGKDGSGARGKRGLTAAAFAGGHGPYLRPRGGSGRLCEGPRGGG